MILTRYNTFMDKLEKIVALSKRRGFAFPSSEIYGGLANTWDYGPLGSLLKRNIENSWWNYFVTKRPEIYGLDTSVIMNPKVWESSGHVENFADSLIDCKNCQLRTRADHLIEDHFSKDKKEIKVEGKSNEELEIIIDKEKILCPNCMKADWTKIRNYSTLFETEVGIITGSKSKVYLRGETAQGMFVDFKQVLDSMSPKLPFGLAQSGLAFRNEITKGRFTFRTLEFHLAEFEYYIKEEEWEKWFEHWKKEIEKWIKSLGVDLKNTRWRKHTEDELSHYSKRTEDIDYNFPFGFKEWCAVAYRTDFDLTNHMQKSGIDLRFTDSLTGEKFIPHVIEPTFGITRTLLVVLLEAYHEEENRVVMKFDPKLSPYKVAVFPLLANKKDLVTKAKRIFDDLRTKTDLSVVFDDRGNIGKRYFAQDEIGTPWCVTVDFKTLEDSTVTVRDRDTMKQIRVGVNDLSGWFSKKLSE